LAYFIYGKSFSGRILLPPKNSCDRVDQIQDPLYMSYLLFEAK